MPSLYEAYFDESLIEQSEYCKEVETEVQFFDSGETRKIGSVAGGWCVEQMEAENNLSIGYTVGGDDISSISIDLDPQNIIISGSAGCGKTTTVMNCLHQISIDGYGFCYFDGYGLDHTKILSQIPKHRFSDVRVVTASSKSEIDQEVISQYVQNDRILLLELDNTRRDNNAISSIVKGILKGQKQSDRMFYIALDHFTLREQHMSRVQLKQLYSNSDIKIGILLVSSHINDCHGHPLYRDYIINHSDYHINFSPTVYQGDWNQDTDWYKKRLSHSITPHESVLCSRGTTDSILYHSYPIHPPMHTEREIFSGPLLRYKL